MNWNKIRKSLLFAFVLFFASFGIAKAYSSAVQKSTIQNWEDNTYGSTSYNLESSVNENTDNLTISLIQKIFGPENPDYQKLVGTGALNFMGNMIAQLYDSPPASSVIYFADLGRNLGIIKPAYAQGGGVGFSGLQNILPLWKASRNLSYVFFVIIFIAIGLAIMFRVKISPQAVVTIQDALPKLIIALILVTFSYAIAGFLIDLIYLLIYIPILVIYQAGLGLDKPMGETQAYFSTLGPFQMIGQIFGIALEGGKNLLGGWGIAGLHVVGGGGIGALAAVLIGSGGIGLGAIAGALFLPVLLLGIIALVLAFKLFFKLLLAYISIIISIIVGPIQIMLGVMPGSSGGFSKWLNSLLANILVFPAVMILIFLARVLVSKAGPSWTPPGLGASGEAISAMIGLGMLLLITKVPDMIKEAFKMKGPGLGSGIGEALGPARKLLGMGYKAGAAEAIGLLEERKGPGSGWAGAISAITGVRGRRTDDTKFSTGKK